MKAFGILFSLFLLQISMEHPVFILDLERPYQAADDSELYRYITKDNLHQIKIEEVKYLRFTNKECKRLPSEIERFKYLEELDLRTTSRGMNVRWVGGGSVFFGHYEKGKLRKLPNWLLEFKNLKKIHLEGQVKLKVNELVALLASLNNLEEISVEISSSEIADLSGFCQIKSLKKIKIQKEGLKETERTRIDKIFSDKKIEYEVESVSRLKLKK